MKLPTNKMRYRMVGPTLVVKYYQTHILTIRQEADQHIIDIQNDGHFTRTTMRRINDVLRYLGLNLSVVKMQDTLWMVGTATMTPTKPHARVSLPVSEQTDFAGSLFNERVNEAGCVVRA